MSSGDACGSRPRRSSTDSASGSQPTSRRAFIPKRGARPLREICARFEETPCRRLAEGQTLPHALAESVVARTRRCPICQSPNRRRGSGGSQELGKIENPDPADVHNSVIKMAKKRALIGALLICTLAASDNFTWDVGDTAPDVPGGGPPSRGDDLPSSGKPAVPRSRLQPHALAGADEDSDGGLVLSPACSKPLGIGDAGRLDQPCPDIVPIQKGVEHTLFERRLPPSPPFSPLLQLSAGQGA